VTEDCGIPATLVEATLWGFEWGTFTGGSPVGLLERAHGGSLYLRRIEQLSLDAQAKLVAFIDTGVVRRLSAPWSTRSDARVVASTSADLVELVNRGAFLDALYGRLTAHLLAIPPLRDRISEIPYLADWYVHAHERVVPGASPAVSPAALECLTAYDWPGNDRELALVIERAALHAAGQTILPQHLPDLAAEMHARHARLAAT
jgi:DNA-binding NtrC family response regulator